MTYTTNDWIKAVSTLLRLTVEGNVKWQPHHIGSEDLPNPADRPGRAFYAAYKARKYRLFSFQRREYDGEYDQFYFVQSYGLDIFDVFGNELLARSIDLRALADLFEAVEQQLAFAKGALNDLLDD